VGLLRYKLEPVQREVYDALHRAVAEEPFVIICHRGFGKTFTGCTYLLEKSRRERDCNQLIISSTLKKLRTIVKPAFDTLLQDCPPDYQPRYDSQDSFYEFKSTNMRTYLLAAQGGHIENARGIHNVTDVLIDEAGFFGDEEDSYPLDHVIQNILLPMFIRTKSKPRIVIMTTPPEIPNHPVKAYYERAKSVGCLEVRDIYHSDIPESKRDEMRGRMEAMPGGEVAWQREMECKWIVDQSRLIIPEWRQEYVQCLAHDKFFEFYHKYNALDTGVRDFTVNLYAYYDFRRACLVVEDETVLKNEEVRTDLLAAAIKMTEKQIGFEKVYRRIGDNNNLIVLQDLSGIHGLPFVPTTKDELFAMVNEVRMWINSKRLLVNPACSHLIGCLANGIWDKQKKEFSRSAVYGHFDGLAALCYLIRNIDTITNPIPAMYGMSVDTHNIPNAKPPESDNYKVLRQAIKLPLPKRTTDDWRKPHWKN
jgi:hypothetical protein